MRLFDSHIHLDDPRFDEDRPALLMQARDAGVVAMIVPGVSQSTWVRTEAVCGEVDGAFPAFGLHPYFLGQHQDSHIEALAQRLDQGDVIAVGECGLDFAIDSLDRDEQTAVFDAQLALAAERDLPA
ncbi:MAG: TatD family hydrolase, partial [Gammaproteobacteria bacterium]